MKHICSFYSQALLTLLKHTQYYHGSHSSSELLGTEMPIFEWSCLRSVTCLVYMDNYFWLCEYIENQPPSTQPFFEVLQHPLLKAVASGAAFLCVSLAADKRKFMTSYRKRLRMTFLRGLALCLATSAALWSSCLLCCFSCEYHGSES